LVAKYFSFKSFLTIRQKANGGGQMAESKRKSFADEKLF
jgi:hypothetical protein